MQTPLIDPQATSYREEKQTTVILHEPLSFKAIPFKDGYRVEFSVKMHWSQVDSMMEENEPIIRGLRNMIEIIEKELNAKVLGIERKDNENNI